MGRTLRDADLEGVLVDARRKCSSVGGEGVGLLTGTDEDDVGRNGEFHRARNAERDFERSAGRGDVLLWLVRELQQRPFQRHHDEAVHNAGDVADVSLRIGDGRDADDVDAGGQAGFEPFGHEDRILHLVNAGGDGHRAAADAAALPLLVRGHLQDHGACVSIKTLHDHIGGIGGAAVHDPAAVLHGGFHLAYASGTGLRQCDIDR